MCSSTENKLVLHRKFRVTITETLKRTVAVEADSQHEAEQIVSDGWHNSNGSEDFVDVNFEADPMIGEP